MDEGLGDNYIRIGVDAIRRLERMYFSNSSIQACRLRIFDAMKTREWSYKNIDVVDSRANPEFDHFLCRKLKRFIEQTLDSLFIKGFVVYRVEPAREATLYPYPCVVDTEDDATYVVKRDNNPDRAISIAKGSAPVDWLGTSTQESSKRRKKDVTYCYCENDPNFLTGEVRSITASLFYHISMTQNLEHSAMYIERVRCTQNVLTKRKTDQAFDERFLTSDIDSTSDERAMLVMENMHLRDQMDTALQRNKTADNQRQDASLTQKTSMHMPVGMYQVQDPLDNWNCSPNFVPLPIDSDVAQIPVVSGRGDLTTMQTNCDLIIKRAFGFESAASKSRKRAYTKTTEDLSANVAPSRLRSMRQTLQTILGDVWEVAYAPLFPRTRSHEVLASAAPVDTGAHSSPQTDADRKRTRGEEHVPEAGRDSNRETSDEFSE
ncbi:hypothetical protein CYMTET_35649 [Cymbomonas tetramitiformis]|uniref:Uncharacterized protein n=1 Tax=Cymbomonas tetramitiformis TaxID=36881 RepID=A0AAE0F8U8_9CHLO|nr:hypothetical protein CYMTET_35649 [Cymbomonas tetramitiformis]|eukprot:gene51-74_t